MTLYAIPKVVTVQQIAAAYHVSERTVYAMGLPRVRLTARTVRYVVRDVPALCNQELYVMVCSLRPSQCARLLQCSVQTVYRLVRQGKLRVDMRGRDAYVDIASLLRLLERTV